MKPLNRLGQTGVGSAKQWRVRSLAVIRVAGAAVHDFAVEIRAEGRLWNFNLDNLYRETGGDPERAAPVLDRFALRMMAPGQASVVESDFAQVKDKLRPALVQLSFIDQNQLAGRPFAADVWEAFAIDGEHELNYVPHAELTRWGLSVEQLHIEAVRALSAASRSVQIRSTSTATRGKYSFIVERDGYDAARLVDPRSARRDWPRARLSLFRRDAESRLFGGVDSGLRTCRRVRRQSPPGLRRTRLPDHAHALAGRFRWRGASRGRELFVGEVKRRATSSTIAAPLVLAAAMLACDWWTQGSETSIIVALVAVVLLPIGFAILRARAAPRSWPRARSLPPPSSRRSRSASPGRRHHRISASASAASASSSAGSRSTPAGVA